MAISKTHYRSISLPSKLPSHDTTNLQPLKNISTVATSSEDIQSGLLKLAQIYNSVQEVSSQQSLTAHLDGSMVLIDSCNTIREMFQMIKENVQSLQSAIRRKGLNSNSIRDDVNAYLCFRKKMNKNLSKTLKNLKNLENKNAPLTEAILIFRSSIMYLCCPVGSSGGWNLISRLMVTRSEGQTVESEIGRLDCALAGRVVDGVMVQRRLQDVDACIGGIEAGFETLYRQMIRCRVQILNILADC